MLRFSFIVPVYNRPQEIKELLDSFIQFDEDNFEVIIVEDGSDPDLKSNVDAFALQFPVSYYFKENTGPGPTRNFGAERAKGDWLIFLDSDTLLPPHYMKAVAEVADNTPIDAFGGADRERDDFLPIQKAISFSMTSFLTTGGIRGSRKSMEKFKPRSFNMGIRKEVFEALEGYSDMRYGEDIDLSLRIENAGFKSIYIPEAYVYHKRRTTFKSFFNQVRHSGEARIELSKKHQGSFRLVHFFPSAFVLGLFIAVLMLFWIRPFGFFGLAVYGIYSLAVWIDATRRYKSFSIGFLSLVAAYVQLFGYGLGLLRAGTISLFKG